MVLGSEVAEEILLRANRSENGARMLESIIDGALLPPVSLQLLQRLSAGQPISRVRFSVADHQFMAEVEAGEYGASFAFAIALTEQRDEQHLCHWWVSTLHASFQPKGILLGMLDVSGRQLECKGWVRGRRSRWYWQWMTFLIHWPMCCTRHNPGRPPTGALVLSTLVFVFC